VPERQQSKKGENMKKAQKKTEDMEMREEYDFSGGVRGKYAKRYAEGTNVIVLDPDVAEMFPDSKSVNEALKYLAKLVRQTQKKTAKAA
jgi:hypothetical protein